MKMLTNPAAAFGQSDESSNNFQIVGSFPQSGSVAIAANDAVAFVYDETTGTLKVEPWDTDAAGQGARLGVGVALDAAAASSGDSVRVVLFGFAQVNIGSGTATENYIAVGSTTKGQVTEAAPDATTVVGTALGVFLADEDGTNNVAPIWVSPR